jgi:signal peptidase II
MELVDWARTGKVHKCPGAVYNESDMKTTKKIMILLLVVILVLVLDQATKQVAQAALASRPMQSFLGDTFRLVYSENTGAFLGLGASLPQWLRVWALVVANSVVLLGVLVFLLRTRELPLAGLVAGALLIAGGIGNIIDRVAHDGRVVDFMNIGIGPLRTGIFNVADLAIVVGVGLLVVWALWEGKRERAGKAEIKEAADDR